MTLLYRYYIKNIEYDTISSISLPFLGLVGVVRGHEHALPQRGALERALAGVVHQRVLVHAEGVLDLRLLVPHLLKERVVERAWGEKERVRWTN